MAIALLLALVAPFAVPTRCRFIALLMAATAFALILFPILTKAYDFRFVIPAVGPLAGAALLGAWGLVLRARSWRELRRPDPQA